MRAVITRVRWARVRVADELVGAIDGGICALVGVGAGDAEADALWIADKIVPPFEVSGFWTYLGSVIIIWLVNMIVYGIFRPENRETKRELTA